LTGRLISAGKRVVASPTAPLVGLAIAVVAALALNFWARHHDYFFYDQYAIVLHRYSFHDLLEPTNGHPVVMWLPVFYLLREIFGLSSALPFEMVSMLAMVAAACVLFAYLSSRADRWVGLAGAVLILFIGAGSDPLFWNFQLAFAGSVGAGIGALVALNCGSRRGDIFAALLLIGSVFFLAVGLSFVAAAAACILARRLPQRRPALARLALVVGPSLFLYLAWYLTYGHDSPSRISLDNVIATPGFVLKGLSASLAFLAGLGSGPTTNAAIVWGLPLLAGLMALAIWRLAAGPPISPTVWAGIAGGLSFWVLTGVNRPIDGSPATGRYCFVGAVFVLLVAVEMIRGLRLSRAFAGIATALILVSVVSNLSGFRYGRNTLAAEAANLRVTLGALDISRQTVDSEFLLAPEVSGSPFEIVVDAASYFKAEDRYGTPALGPRQLLKQPEPLRANADSVLRAALPMTLTAGAPRPNGLECILAERSGPRAKETITARQAWLRAGPNGATVAIRRFARRYAPVGTIEPNQTAKLSIPPDRSSVPWQLSLMRGKARLCKS